MRHTGSHAAVDVQLFQTINLLKETITQRQDALVFLNHLFFGNAESLAHAHTLVSSQGTGTHAALMTATVGLGFQTHARLAAHEQRTDTFGAVGFVRREGHQINFQRFQIDRHLARGLCGINVEKHATRTGQLTERSNIVNRADLIIDVHDRHQNGVFTQRSFNQRRRNQTVFARLKISHLKAFTLKLAHGVEHRFVLDLRGNQVLAFTLVEVGNAFDRQVVGLGGTRGPDNFTRIGIDQLSYLTTGILYRFFSLPAKHMGARGRIAEVTVNQQAFTHFLRNTRINRRGGGIIEVNRQFHQLSPNQVSGQLASALRSIDGGRLDLIQVRRPAITTALILALGNFLHLTTGHQVGKTDATEKFVYLLAEVAP